MTMKQIETDIKKLFVDLVYWSQRQSHSDKEIDKLKKRLSSLEKEYNNLGKEIIRRDRLIGYLELTMALAHKDPYEAVKNSEVHNYREMSRVEQFHMLNALHYWCIGVDDERKVKRIAKYIAYHLELDELLSLFPDFESLFKDIHKRYKNIRETHQE